MTTLFERILSTSEDGADKISIHMIQSLIIEFRAGALTRPQVVGILALTPAQEADLVTIYQALTSATNKQAFWQRVFAHLLLGESSYRARDNGLAGYLIEVNFWTMISDEGTN